MMDTICPNGHECDDALDRCPKCGSCLTCAI
jgi:hypothetical protein